MILIIHACGIGVHNTWSMRVGTGRKHDQPVEAERYSAGGRHARERGEKILVDRVALAVDACLFRHLLLQPPALIGRIGEFAEAVGELDPAGIKLEALGETRIGRLRPGQRRLHRRIVAENDRAAQILRIAQRGARPSRPIRG